MYACTVGIISIVGNIPKNNIVGNIPKNKHTIHNFIPKHLKIGVPKIFKGKVDQNVRVPATILLLQIVKCWWFDFYTGVYMVTGIPRTCTYSVKH